MVHMEQDGTRHRHQWLAAKYDIKPLRPVNVAKAGSRLVRESLCRAKRTVPPSLSNERPAYLPGQSADSIGHSDTQTRK